MIRALIVDDERRARAYLAKLVAPHLDVTVVGEARDGVSALEAVERLAPDLVFLDVQMPEMDGLEVARRLSGGGRCPLVVFTTAYDQFALTAFEVSAIDYLLKPYDGERLARSLDRARVMLKGAAGPGEAAGPSVADRLARLLDVLDARTGPATEAERGALLARLPVQARGSIMLIELDDVYQIASDDRLVFAHTRSDRYLVNFSIKDLEGRLPADRFFRTHRSSIVNLRHVREIVPWFHGKLMLKLDNGSEVTVSEDRAPRLRSVIGIAPPV